MNSPVQQSPTAKKKYTSWATIPFIPGISYKIRRALNKSNIGVAFKPGTKIKQLLSKPKSKTPPALSKNIIYKISCECDKQYTGLTTQNAKKEWISTKIMSNLNWGTSG